MQGNLTKKTPAMSMKQFMVLSALVFVSAIFSPAIAFAATPHVKESASEYIEKTRSMYGAMVNDAARIHGVDPKLVLAVIVIESEGNQRVTSRKGAQGLMQLMPETAREMGAKDTKEPMQNILAGTRYLKELADLHGFNSTGEVLVAYNMGPTRAKQWLSLHPGKKYGYVENVMYVYRILEEDEQANKDFAKNVAKQIVNQDMLAGLRPLVAGPRLLSLATFPMTIPSSRRNEIQLEN